MNAILSIVLAMSGLADPPACLDGPAGAEPLPVVAMACGDWIDLVQLLEEPGVETIVLGAWQYGDAVVVGAMHSIGGTESHGVAWAGYYAFPSTIYAHSIVTVPFHAEEME